MIRWCAALAVLVSIQVFAKPPRLTLFISVDSLGSDVFQRNRPRFKGGFARLINEGAYFPIAKYEVAECVTGSGHATLTTGSWPWRHGVVGNRVFNSATGKIEPVFADDKHPVLDAPLGNDDVSPLNLLAETLSDHLRTHTALRGRSVAISGKGRSAVPMAGRLGDAWWFHDQVGRFVTGTWYRKQAPTWVTTFNDRKLPDGYHGKRWELLGTGKDLVGEDDRPFEADLNGMGRTFPHPLNGGLPSPGPASYGALASSPMMNEVVVEFAKAAIDGEQLGKDEVPDLLSVSFSPLDRTYHLYGPTSWETQDHLVRLDKAVGDLLALAEKAAGGKQNLVVVLSADHGGADIPEQWAAQGVDGVRVAPVAIQKGLNEELEKRFGVGNLIVAIDEVDLYLDHKALEAKKLDGAAVRRAAAAWLSKHPDVQFAVARDDLATADRAGLTSSLRHGYVPGRSGDVLMVMKPFHVLENEPRGTSHGTPWAYDAEVPLFLFGRGVKSGVYGNMVRAVDVAPTVSALMEMGSPAMNEGAVLFEALALPK